MKHPIRRLLLWFEGYAHCWWYTPLIALLAALDAYILFVPNEAILIPAVLVHPRRWVITTVWVVLGSALGATSFAALASTYGESFVGHMFPNLLYSKAWADSVRLIHQHGFWGLTLISASPFPQHAAVAMVGLAHMSLYKVFFSVTLGRAAKHLFVAWSGVHSTKLLKRFFR